jgi:hypothetical protein
MLQEEELFTERGESTPGRTRKPRTRERREHRAGREGGEKREMYIVYV